MKKSKLKNKQIKPWIKFYPEGVKENLKYLAGDVISPFNEMIVPINKKVFDKIKKIKKRG